MHIHSFSWKYASGLNVSPKWTVFSKKKGKKMLHVFKECLKSDFFS